MVKAGIATIALRRYDLMRALELASQAGFTGVEIWGKPPHTPELLDKEYWQKVQDKLQELNLEVSMFGSYINPSWQDFKEKTALSFAVSDLLGIKMMRVWAGNAEPKAASDDLWKSTIKAYKELCKRAADSGMTLAIEMHAGTLCLTPEGSLRMLEGVGADNLKLNYQIGNPAKIDLEHDVSIAGPYIVNIHAQNYLPTDDEGEKYQLSLVEEGVVDYRKLLELLKPYGFSGYIEVEFLKGEFESEETMLDSLNHDAKYLKTVTSG